MSYSMTVSIVLITPNRMPFTEYFDWLKSDPVVTWKTNHGSGLGLDVKDCNPGWSPYLSKIYLKRHLDVDERMEHGG